MITEHLVDISRLQFAVTALYHFLFVPLTLGMVWLLVIMESMYVMTGKTVWKDMTRFWGKLFGINFALGSSVWYPLGLLFSLCRRYFWRTLGDWRADGVLFRVHYGWAVFLWLGQTVTRSAFVGDDFDGSGY